MAQRQPARPARLFFSIHPSGLVHVALPRGPLCSPSSRLLRATALTLESRTCRMGQRGRLRNQLRTALWLVLFCLLLTLTFRSVSDTPSSTLNCSRALRGSIAAYQKAVSHVPHPYLPASAPGGPREVFLVPSDSGKSLQLCSPLPSPLRSRPLACTPRVAPTHTTSLKVPPAASPV